MLKIQNLSVVAEDQPILNDINLEINSKEIHALIGPKHSGKSAVAHAITGHPDIVVTEGDIIWNEKNLTVLDPDDRVQNNIFISFQNPPEFEDFTSWEITQEFFKNKKIDVSELFLKYFAYCELLELGREHTDKRLHGMYMNVSQAKRNELLYMLLSNPKLVILDEIDDGLSDHEVENIGKLLKDFLTETECSCLVITHNQKLLDILNPTHAHVMISGKIKTLSDVEIYKRIVEDGYSEFS